MLSLRFLNPSNISSRFRRYVFVSVAQLEEHLTFNQRVVGSTPTRGID